MRKILVPTFITRRRATAVLSAALALGTGASLPATAAASRSQIAIIQDGSDLSDPAGTMAQFRELGASTIRVVVPWATIAPAAASKHKPSFDATDPNAYKAANWAPYDNIVREAKVYGMTVDFTVTGGAPRWAEASTPPRTNEGIQFLAWKPDAAAYGQFVQAVGKRYGGQFTPHGQSTPLPAVHFWAIFNEPNFGNDLGPQAINGSTVSTGPMMYRSLVNAGWRALKSTGHGHDTILIGEFAARGIGPGGPSRRAPQGYPGNFGQTKPLQFIRTLYCVDAAYRELRGSAARSVGCPTTAGASRRFRTQNPGLFSASGVSDHPYPGNMSPVTDGTSDPDFATLPDLGRLESALDRVNRAYGSGKRYSIYNDEYGYITNPPNGGPVAGGGRYLSPAIGAAYINWAEYLSWKSPRVASYMQYLLRDPSPTAGAYAGFASGLEFYTGKHKPGFDSYRLPVYLPRTTFSRSSNVELWGDVRPAPSLKTDGAQIVSVQLNGTTVTTVRATAGGGYFDIHLKFPHSGTVRLAYTYPKTDSLLPIADLGKTVYSRSVNIGVH